MLAANDYIFSMIPRSKKNPGLWCLKRFVLQVKEYIFQSCFNRSIRLCPGNCCSVFTSEFLSSALSGVSVIRLPTCWHSGLDQQGKRCGEGGGGRRSLLQSLQSGTCEKETLKIGFPSFLTRAVLLSFVCPDPGVVLGKCMWWRTRDCEPYGLE